MSWRLAITDNGDAASVTAHATVEDGVQFRIQKRRIHDELVLPWEFATSALTESPGGTYDYDIDGLEESEYEFRITNDLGSVIFSSVVFVRVTADGWDSLHWRCALMIADRISAIGLPGCTGGVIRQLGGETEGLSFPCVLVAIAPAAVVGIGGTNIHDDYELPVMLWIIDRIDWNTDIKARRLLYWRERIRKGINEQKWDVQVPEVAVSRYFPGLVIEPDYQNSAYRKSLGTVKCIARQRRRLTDDEDI